MIIRNEEIGDERLEVFAMWRTGSGSKEKRGNM